MSSTSAGQSVGIAFGLISIDDGLYRNVFSTLHIRKSYIPYYSIGNHILKYAHYKLKSLENLLEMKIFFRSVHRPSLAHTNTILNSPFCILLDGNLGLFGNDTIFMQQIYTRAFLWYFFVFWMALPSNKIFKTSIKLAYSTIINIYLYSIHSRWSKSHARSCIRCKSHRMVFEKCQL